MELVQYHGGTLTCCFIIGGGCSSPFCAIGWWTPWVRFYWCFLKKGKKTSSMSCQLLKMFKLLCMKLLYCITIWQSRDNQELMTLTMELSVTLVTLLRHLKSLLSQYLYWRNQTPKRVSFETFRVSLFYLGLLLIKIN